MTRKRLTPKQAKFADEYIKNGQNGTKAALVAYDAGSENMAAVIGSKNLQNESIAKQIANALAKKNITADTIAETIADGLTANKLYFDLEKHDLIETTQADHLTRHKFLTTLIDLTGAKAPEKREIKISGLIAVDKLAEIRKRVGV